MTPLPPYEHLDPDPLWVMPEECDCEDRFRRNESRHSRVGWLLVSLVVVLLVTVSVALFLRGFGA